MVIAVCAIVFSARTPAALKPKRTMTDIQCFGEIIISIKGLYLQKFFHTLGDFIIWSAALSSSKRFFLPNVVLIHILLTIGMIKLCAVVYAVEAVFVIGSIGALGPFSAGKIRE